MKEVKNNKSSKDGPVQKVSGKIAKNAKANNKQNKPAKIQKTVNNLDVKAQVKEQKLNKNKKPKQNSEQKTVKDEDQPNATGSNSIDTAKLEKKKAKKLAQKLKKEKRKANNQSSSSSKPGSPAKTKLNQNGSATKENTNLDGNERQRRDPALDASTVFVGNLPVTTKRVQIVKLFTKFGGVKSIRLRTAAGQVIFKHKQRKQAGSLNAYVVLNSPEAAQKALELNGHEFKEFHLRVTPADAEKHRKDHDPKLTVFVGNLKYTANEEKLRNIFSNCGEINYIRCLYDGKNKCKGVGYVCFKSPEAVGLALELNETILDERPIHVERYSSKKLGAKAARDKVANANQKSGAKKRIDSKQKGQKGTSNDVKDKKKSEFRGVKVSGIKKKNKKKVTNEMKTIAKKIAPKLKTQKE